MIKVSTSNLFLRKAVTKEWYSFSAHQRCSPKWPSIYADTPHISLSAIGQQKKVKGLSFLPQKTSWERMQPRWGEKCPQANLSLPSLTTWNSPSTERPPLHCSLHIAWYFPLSFDFFCFLKRKGERAFWNSFAFLRCFCGSPLECRNCFWLRDSSRFKV